MNGVKLVKNHGLRKRVICLGLVLIPINGWWLIQMEEFRRSVSTGGEYTFNCDDPMACITAFDETTTVDDKSQAAAIDEPETPEIVVVDEQPESSKL